MSYKNWNDRKRQFVPWICGCRHPRTTQERRITGKRNVIRQDGYEVYIRPARSAANLPTSYDDIWVREHWEGSDGRGPFVCWKRKRRHQWRVVEG